MKTIPSDKTLGAEISGVDVSVPPDTQTVDAIYQAILDHCVIYFRNQTVAQRQLVDFTNCFGVASHAATMANAQPKPSRTR